MIGKHGFIELGNEDYNKKGRGNYPPPYYHFILNLNPVYFSPNGVVNSPTLTLLSSFNFP